MKNKFVVIDLETTGHHPNEGDRIIEVGIAVIENDQITSTYTTLLNPNQPIPTFISNLTGITNEDVGQAPFFEDKADEIVAFFHDAYFIAHNVPFDLRFLNEELLKLNKSQLTNSIIDTVELARILYPQADGYKLNQLASYLHIEHNEPHRAISDAYVTAKLFLKIKTKLANLPYETIDQLLKLENSFHSDLHDLLSVKLDRLAFSTTPSDITTFQGLAFKNDLNENDILDEYDEPFGYLLDYIYESNGAMEKEITNYENRQGQREISETISDALQASKHALIEAGTGSGKSLAYLIPSVYQAIRTNERIVISTYTTQLQAQLLYEEIPLLKKLLPFSFNVALLKGKHHYISLERFAWELAKQDIEDNYDIALTKAMILVWLTETSTGDIDEIQLPASGYFFYNQVCTKSEGKLDPASPWFHYSFYQRAKTSARQSDLIITNHALLCTDLFNDHQFIPSYDRVIIDEAHHFERAASKQSSLTLDHVQLQYSLNQIGTTTDNKWISKVLETYPDIHKSMPMNEWNSQFEQAKYDIDCLFEAVSVYVKNKRKRDKGTSDVGRIQYRLDSKVDNNTIWDGIREMANRVIFRLKDLIKILTAIEGIIEKDIHYTNHDGDDLNNFTELLESFIEQIEQYFIYDEYKKNVRWIELEGKDTVYLYKEATDVSTYLATEFFNVKQSVILTSATLTMRNSFSYMINQLGMQQEHLITKQFPSPFDYKNQVQLMVPNDFPHIVHDDLDDYIYSTCEAIVSLAEITKGRLLVLFTSYNMLKKTYNLLRETIENDEYMLIAQGISSGSRTRLKKNFQSFSNAILLGTSSFWEGVDIPGEDLSCLMIIRLPFQPPTHPVFEAKANELEKLGENPFFKLSLPDAVIRFKQGFGRLIRSGDDRGIVFICDARIIASRYGSFFTKSIPDVNVTYDTTASLMQKASQWFN